MDFLFDGKNILSYYNKKINEKTKLVDLQSGSNLYNQIRNDTRLGPWQIKELNDNIKQIGNELIENFISYIKNENDQDKIKKYIKLLKNINIFFVKNKEEFDKNLNLLQEKIKIINNSNINSKLLNDNISIVFHKRKKNCIKLKPIHILFNYSIKNSIKLIMNRYKKIVETNNETFDHLEKRISFNLKKYQESFYIKPWKSIIHHKNPNNNIGNIEYFYKINIESTCYKYVIYDDHTKIIKEYKSKNLSNYQYPEAKNNLNRLFNIIWDYYLSEYKLMLSPIYIHGVNKYETLENLAINWFEWWRYLLNNPNLNIVNIYWIFKNVEELNAKTKDKNFYKMIGSMFIENLIKCNQEHKNICIPEIIQKIESEIDCQTLTTDELYNSLLKNEYFIKLVKLSINEISEIHYHITNQKNKLKKSCTADFVIEDFSTNNRFENFLKGDYLELEKELRKNYIEDNKKLSEDEDLDEEIKNSKLSPDKINKLQDLRKNRLNNFITEKINEFKNKIKLSKTEKELDDISDILISDKILSDEQKDNIVIIFREKLKSIKESDKYNEFIRDINDLYTEDDLNLLKDKLSYDQILTPTQKDKIKKSIDDKIDEIKKTALQSNPNKNILVDELEKDIENINKNNAEKLLDDKDLDKKIKDSKLSPSNNKKIQELRKNKLLEFRNKINDEYINNIKTEKNKNILADINNDLTKNKILTDKQINNISSLIIEKITKINENNEIYDEIKTDIDGFLTPENLDNFIKKISMPLMKNIYLIIEINHH
ncbi:6982_t:CDS:2 [Scutellospora calospora]|uniref:6982_t:CDS:1 n=1 Tax=Scutellospora calospora TaxID=85575 RepID=A0ACA9KMX3_9GLOM|nr:6982_t:CDS:2 [Scutellospora calospora]